MTTTLEDSSINEKETYTFLLNFTNTSWGDTLKFALAIILSPLLVILSKLLKKEIKI